VVIRISLIRISLIRISPRVHRGLSLRNFAKGSAKKVLQKDFVSGFKGRYRDRSHGSLDFVHTDAQEKATVKPIHVSKKLLRKS